MRYINSSALRPGMKVADAIYEVQGRPIVDKGTVLTADRISYISFVGIQGLYIEDELENSVDVVDLVKPEIRKTAGDVVENFFSKSKGISLTELEEHIMAVVSTVVDEVLKNKDVMTNLVQIRTYDQYTYFHSVDVGVLAGIIGAKYGLNTEALKDLVMAGFLHDIGKVFISPDIINAPRRLDDAERIKMMEHPRLGYEYLIRKYHFSDMVNRTVLEHHEWFNGLGYPNKKEGKGLLITSRILKAADVYDAMTTKRPYHPPYLPSEVMEYIMGRSGLEFDPRVVEVMSRELNVYPLGCRVELSDGTKAIVVGHNTGMILRPTVETINDKKIIDLYRDRDAWSKTIVKMII
ncbi:MAG: HD-GYP domain-containing protein [Lachnospiraceae bacterium]|nr:HD-GYP domain-containing protein [Lachnospiraceae bacterium]